MRVLHVSSGNLYGGIEAMLAALARHRGECPAMVPEFALCFEGRSSEELRVLGVPVHVVGAVRASRPLSVWRARRALGAVLRRGAYDAVVCHAPWPHAVFAPVVRAAGLPLVFWAHGTLTGRHWIERWARLTAPDLAVCNSWYTAGTLGAVFAGVPTAVVHPPVAPPAGDVGAGRAAIRDELATPAGHVVVLHVGRMEPLKGHRVLLEALGALHGVAGWTCWLAGGAQRPEEERYVEELRGAAREAGVADRVRFLGQRADVARLYAAADVYCQPNTGPEGFGITFVEALYAGLPVVSTSLGAAPEVVDRSCGVLVTPKDVAELAATLGRLLTAPETRARLAAAAPARAERLCAPAARLADVHAALATTVSAAAARGSATRSARTSSASAVAA